MTFPVFETFQSIMQDRFGASDPESARAMAEGMCAMLFNNEPPVSTAPDSADAVGAEKLLADTPPQDWYDLLSGSYLQRMESQLETVSSEIDRTATIAWMHQWQSQALAEFKARLSGNYKSTQFEDD